MRRIFQREGFTASNSGAKFELQLIAFTTVFILSIMPFLCIWLQRLVRRSKERVLNLLSCLPIVIFSLSERASMLIPITLILSLFAFMKFPVRREAFVIIETSIFFECIKSIISCIYGDSKGSPPAKLNRSTFDEFEMLSIIFFQSSRVRDDFWKREWQKRHL